MRITKIGIPPGGSTNQVLVKSSGTDYDVEWGTGSGTATPPGGTNTQVQFNDGGIFGGDAGFTYNKTTNRLTLGSLVLNDVIDPGVDTDKFLVLTSLGVVSYRTGSEVLADIGLTNPVTGTGSSGQVAYWNGTNTITGESNLFWDAANDRLGIGTASPAYTLDVNGTARIQDNLTISDAKNVILGTTTGTKIGTATTQKIGFFNATPVVQPSAVTTIQGMADALTSLGLLASSTISGSFWDLGSGGTLTGANTITGTTTNTIKFVFNGLTSLASNLKKYGAGLWLANTSSASSGTITSQQMSPLLVLEGQGYDITNAVSKSSKWIIINSPGANYGDPTGTIRFDYAVGTADPSYVFQINSPGAIEAGDLGSLIFGGAAGNHTSRIIFTTTGAKWRTRTNSLGIDLHSTNGVTITGNATFSDGITISDAKNVVLSTTTGSKIGTSTTQKIGFFNATPVVQPSAYTQTYSTATKTHNNLTSSDLTGITSSTTGSALAEPSATYTQSELQQNFRRLQDQYNALKADLTNLKQVVNQIIDDNQSLGLFG